MEKRFAYFNHLALISILIVGCFWVLRPFLTATLLAAVICISTWPIYAWLLRKMKGMKNIAALLMSFLLVVVIILPLSLVAYNLADSMPVFYDAIKQAVDDGTWEPPTWLTNIPIIGSAIDEYWHLLTTSREAMATLLKSLLEPAKDFLLAGGLMLGQGVVEMSLAAFVSFFFYRDGAALVHFLGVMMHKMVGAYAQKVFETIKHTVQGVMYGLLGTAVAQGFVATLGFFIAGIPGALALGVATALLSIVPIGPPIIWGGAAIWLFNQGMTGWGIFMLVWGLLLISSVDNVVKPLLISQGSNLPFILVLFGVGGGIVAFGFVGVFIGPTLLAVGYNLMQEWVTRESPT